MTEFSEIELTPDEIFEVILKAKSDKSVKIQYEKNEILRRQKSKELTEPFTPEQLINYCHRFYLERFNKEFVIDDSNKDLVNKLSLYFTNDETFNVANYSLNKGILIMGNVGRGKTELMKFFQKNKKRCYTIKTCIGIADEFLLYTKDDEVQIEDIYSTPIEKPLHDHSVFFQKYIGYCFDDLGTEEQKNNYGNKKNVMADILMAIYNKKDYSKFHLTTNMTNDELETKYGTRVRSRLREMFNLFVLDGKDRRQ